MMMPASYFYQLCWIYRIPFIYCIGVNISRLFYGSWFITNESYDVDVTLILLTAALYVYAWSIRIGGWIGKRFELKKRRSLLKEQKKKGE